MIPQIQRRALRLARSDRFDSLVRALAPLSWLSLREASGAIADNAMYSQALGAEIVLDGDFASAVNWSAPSPWTISGGKLSLPSDPGGNVVTTQALSVSQGDTLQYQVDCDTADGSVDVQHDGVSIFPNIAAPGTLADRHIYRGVTNVLGFRGQSGGSPAQFDNISVRKEGEYDLDLTGGVTLAQAGLLGGSHAYALDGSTGVGTLYNRASIQGLSAFTLSQLIKPDTLSNGDTLWFKADEIEVWLNADGSLFARAHYDTTDSETSSAVGVLNAGVWAFVHVVLDDSDDTLSIYVNDVLVNDTVQAGAGSRVSNTNHLLLWKNASSNGFDGLVDEVFLRDSATSAAALAAIAHALGLS